MKNRMDGNWLKSIPWLLLVAFSTPIFGQNPQLKEFKSFEYSYSKGDSVLTYKQVKKFDPEGLLIFKERFDYIRIADSSVLNKYKLFTYNPDRMSAEIINKRPRNSSRNNSRKIRYIKYGETETDQKPVSIQEFDQDGDLLREDTLSYNKDLLKTEKCSYGYTGSTSLFCDEYRYSKKGKLRRWKMFSKWNTINLNGKTIVKKGKRRDFKYYYNKNGDLRRVCGRYYASRYRERLTYDKNGMLATSSETWIRKKRKKGAKRKIKTIKSKNWEFQNGRKVREYKVENGKVISEILYEFKDSLLVKKEVWANDQLVGRYEWKYNSEAIQSQYKYRSYRNGEVIDDEVKQFDLKGNEISRVKTIRGRPLIDIRKELVYNVTGKLVLERQFTKNVLKFIIQYSYDEYGMLTKRVKSNTNDLKLREIQYINLYY